MIFRNILIFYNNNNDYIKIFNKDSGCNFYSTEPNYMYINGNYESFQTYYNFNKTDNNITLVWTNPIGHTHCMFDGCKDIIDFDFSNLDSSKITHMGAMFRGCISLKSLNLSYFNTPLLTQTSNMFFGCTSLESLDLSNFKTSKLQNLINMFKHCLSLKALSLPNFNTELNLDTNCMFFMCSSLEYINIGELPIHNNLYNVIFNIGSQKFIICGNGEKLRDN